MKRNKRRHAAVLMLPPPAPYVPPTALAFQWPANPISAQIRARQRMAALVAEWEAACERADAVKAQIDAERERTARALLDLSPL